MTFKWDPDDIDEATNLPRVPEGYFWRVGDDGLGIAQVMLKRHRKGWFPAEEGNYCLHWAQRDIREEGSVYFDPEDPEDLVYIAARAVLNERADELNKRQKNREIADLFGDYPPKKL